MIFDILITVNISYKMLESGFENMHAMEREHMHQCILGYNHE